MSLGDDSILRQVIVQICVGDSVIGSGCVVPSARDGLFYCLTARHCLEKGEITLHRLADSGEAIPLKYTKRIMDSSFDAAILELDRSFDDYPKNHVFTGKISPMYDRSTITLVGYPENRAGELTNCEVSIHHMDIPGKGAIYLNLQNINTFESNLYEQIVGISGGGCFALDEGRQYKLLGIETGFVDKKQTFGEIISLDLSVFENLLARSEWPPLARPRYRYASMAWNGGGRNVLELSLGYGWVNTKPSRPLIQEIQRYLLHEDNVPLLVNGFSGSGKTRTVLRACTEDAELSNALIFNSYKQFSEAFDSGLYQYCREAVDEPVYLIVDDLTIDQWYELKVTIGPCKNIHAIAVAELGENQKRRDLPMLRMEPCDQEDVAAIISNTHPSLDESELLAIYRLSSNDLRFALLIAYMYERDADRLQWDMKNLSSDSTSASLIVSRIMSQVSDLSENDAVKIFSLFIDFGYIDTGKKELDFLSKYFNIPKSKLKDAIEICIDHRLGIPRGNYFELSPRAFARLLFVKYNDDLIGDLPGFMDQIPTDALRERFLMRARECGDKTWTEVRGALSPWFRKKYGHTVWAASSSVYSGESFEPSVGGSEPFPVKEAMTIVEFLPEEGLPWMKRLIHSAGAAVLDRFGLYPSDRREFVWTCEHLACFAEHFDICEDILFELGLHETEFGISNNSRGVWAELFGLFLSNTETPFPSRFQLLLRRMKSFQSGWPEQMFQSALSAALSWSGTCLLPPKMIGGRLTPEDWARQNIKTMQDLVDVQAWMMRQLYDVITELPQLMRQIVFDCLKAHIADYTSLSIVRFVPELRDAYCHTLEEYAETSDKRTEIVIAINTQLELQKHMDDRKKEDDQSTQARIAFLTQWKDSLADMSYISRLNILLSKDIFWDTEEVQSGLAQLSTELLSDSDPVRMLGEILSRCCLTDYSFTRFATAVGEADISGKLLPEAKRLFAQGDSAFSENYFYGVCGRGKGVPDFVRDMLEECAACAPKGVLHISVAYDHSGAGLERICRLLRQGVMDNSMLGMADARWARILTLEQAEDILSLLMKSESNDGQYYFLCIGREWIKTFQQHEYAKFLLDCASAMSFKSLQQHSYPFILMMELMPAALLRDCLMLVIHSLNYSHKMEYLPEHIRYIQKHATGPYAQDIAMEVCDCIYMNAERARYGIPCSTLVGLLHPQSVLHWIDNDATPQQRAEFIAYHLPAPSLKKVSIPEVTLSILNQFEYDEAVFHRFCMGIHSHEVYSYEEIAQEREKVLALLKQYDQHPSESIRRWADFERSRIDRIMDTHRQLKAEDARFRDS